jgi:hypothetical protein
MMIFQGNPKLLMYNIHMVNKKQKKSLIPKSNPQVISVMGRLNMIFPILTIKTIKATAAAKIFIKIYFNKVLFGLDA